MNEDLIGYGTLIDDALRSVVRKVLRVTEKEGLRGEHHFYISFKTRFPGVQISDELLAKYPDEMTIVLQHQFWDLKVEEHSFSVALSFNKVRQKLVIPYQALTAFADPSIKFGLQFQTTAMHFEDEHFDPNSDELPLHDGPPPTAQIISLDSFRKKP